MTRAALVRLSGRPVGRIEEDGDIFHFTWAILSD